MSNELKLIMQVKFLIALMNNGSSWDDEEAVQSVWKIEELIDVIQS